MERACPACGADTGDGAAVCPTCGLALAVAESAATDAQPEHVAVLMGSVPVIESAAPDASAASEARVVEEAASASPSGPWLSPRVVVAIVVLLALAVVATIWFGTRPRTDDPAGRAERAYLGLARSELLDPAELAPFDPDALVASLAPDGDVMAKALALHRPVERTESMSIHGYFEALDARQAALSPAWAIESGRRPAPLGEDHGSAGDLASWLLACDAWKTLRDWPGAEALPLHDRIDREALLGAIERSIRVVAADPSAGLLELHTAFDPLVTLRDGARPADERCDDALVYLADLNRRLPRRVADLDASVSQAQVVAVADRMADAAAYLATYAEWPGLGEARRAALHSRALALRDVVHVQTTVLRTEVAPRAKGAAGMGRTALTARLIQHGLDPRPSRAYDAALRVLSRELDVLRDLAPTMLELDVLAHPPVPDEFLDRLRARTPEWIGVAGDAAAPRIVVPPELWRGDASGWYARGHGVEPPIVYLAPLPPRADAFARACDAVRLRHTLAHEGYPGHRLHDWVTTCDVRAYCANAVTLEGWAVYAEDLFHEDGPCADRDLDAYVRAWDRWQSALAGLDSILIAAGSRADDVQRLRRLNGAETSLEAIGSTAISGIYQAAYVLGPPEVRRLREREEERLGDRFDAKAFHLRFLRSGPIPIRLIEKEWDEEDAAR